ncbi:hypothetical protein HPULCUR_010286 [Helicostylum pulchrum]|uniref:Galactose oxidase n=1 Tax=Helicostylum pulchrum TaxID=562976 RepID=A0ABP9YCT6_9FUNG
MYLKSCGSDTDYSADSSLMYLDIVYSSGNSTKELATRWTTIAANTNGVNIQSRRFPQSMVLPDGKTMILSGGWNTDKSGLVSQTIAYSADNNSWSVYPSYTESPLGVRQIYYASSVYIPEYGVGFYGGIETNINRNWTYRGQNMSQYEYPKDITARAIGYTSLTFFDIRKNVDPWFVFPTQNDLPTVFSGFQTSIFDNLSNRIFFFGGAYRNSTFYPLLYYSFGTSITFNVESGTWGSQILGGIIPSGRAEHTTTLLSSTNRDVLLYGGLDFSNNNKPVLDYLFTLNLDSYEWKQQNIQNPNALDLIRAQHSAVPVYNNTLFIVFGRGASGVSVSSMVILNVTDPSNISYLSTYVDPNGVENSNIYEEEKSSDSLGLSEGVTAGIAVGTIIAKDELEEIRRRNERIEAPVMEVNWEVIDQNYEKFATNATKNSPYSSRLSDSPTAMAPNKPEFFTGPLLVPEGLEHQRPDAIEDNVKSFPTVLQKPDGVL